MNIFAVNYLKILDLFLRKDILDFRHYIYLWHLHLHEKDHLYKDMRIISKTTTFSGVPYSISVRLTKSAFELKKFCQERNNLSKS